MAYAEWWRISEAFMNAYYKQKGFTAQKEETEYQRTVTERRLDLAEESAELAQELQKKQVALLESAETRAVSAEERAVAVEGRADVQGKLDSEFARRIMQAQLESLQLGNQWTRKKIREEGTSDELADQLFGSSTFYQNVSPSIFNAVLSGDYEQIVNAFIQNSLDKSLIPSEEIIAYSLEQESPILFDYFRKIMIDAATKGVPEGAALEEFRKRYGNLANIEDLLQLPKETPFGDRGGQKQKAIKETQRFFPGLEYQPGTIPERDRGPLT